MPHRRPIKSLSDPTPTRGRPTAFQSARISDRIIAAAWDVLLDTGPEHFIIDKVAPVAQASKQTIYARFPGKLSLLSAVLVTRMDLIFTEMRNFPDAPDVATAFARQAQRIIESMMSPESRMLDRLVDWIDVTASTESDMTARATMYEKSCALISQQLVHAMERWNIVIDDVPSASAFWLDGLFGHVRGLAPRETQKDAWSLNYARYFLRAVIRTDNHPQTGWGDSLPS